MESPLFKTLKNNLTTDVTVFKDRLEYESRGAVIPRDSLKLTDIRGIRTIPKPPGQDPSKTDLSIEISGRPNALILQDLDTLEAENIKTLISAGKKRAINRQEFIEEHPFTVGGRMVKQTSQKFETKTHPVTSRNLSFKNKLFGFLLIGALPFFIFSLSNI